MQLEGRVYMLLFGRVDLHLSTPVMNAEGGVDSVPEYFWGHQDNVPLPFCLSYRTASNHRRIFLRLSVLWYARAYHNTE
jgi:hypothetical protein